MQNSLATLINNGELKRHVKKAKKIYQSRRDYLDVLLKSRLAKYIDYKLPTGGMAIWVQIKPQYSVGLLQEIPRVQLPKIFEEQNAFRFGFASMNKDELEASVVAIEMKFQTLDNK